MNPTTTRTGRSPRLRKRELFRSIGYVPHGVQVEVHRSRARTRVLVCGTRFGKSTCAAMEAVAALLEPRADSLGWVVGPNLEVTGRVIDRVRMVLHEHFAWRIEKDVEREKRVVVRNLGGGVSELRGKSADAPASLLGAELDWLVVDECASVRRAVWEERLSARLLGRRGWSLLVGTPQELDWFADLFLVGLAGTDREVAAWRAPTWENPHIARELIEAERGRLATEVFEQQYAARFLGERPERCEVCGCPSDVAPKWMIVWHEDRLVWCRACRNVVNRLGRTLVHRRSDGSIAVHALVHGIPGGDDVENEGPPDEA